MRQVFFRDTMPLVGKIDPDQTIGRGAGLTNVIIRFQSCRHGEHTARVQIGDSLSDGNCTASDASPLATMTWIKPGSG